MTIEAAITGLVQRAPELPAALVDDLLAKLRAITAPDAAVALARSIARVVELVAERVVDPGIALPALAMACATLEDGRHGRLAAPALEAARFEIETLLPVPGAKPVVTAPDVPISALRRR